MEKTYKILMGYMPIRNQADECHSQGIYDDCGKYAYDRGYIRSESSGGHYSELKAENPESVLSEIVVQAKLHQFDILVIHSISSLKLKTVTLLNFVRELEEVGIDLLSVNDAIDIKTPAGKFLLQLSASVAERERNFEEIKTLTPRHCCCVNHG